LAIPTLGELQRLDVPRIAAALSVGIAEAQREVGILLTRALGIGAARLIAHPELRPDPQSYATYAGWLQRRLMGEPVAYLLGYREFFGLNFKVSPAVLIPRPETELLVELALERIPESQAASILDLGTGSGCIAITLARLRPRARIVATDISIQALAIATENAAQHDVQHIEFREGSWFDPVEGERFDLVVSNPPYVVEHDAHLSQGDLRFEPYGALVAGSDGFAMLRNIVQSAPKHLRDAGSLILEHGFDQALAVRSLLERHGFADIFTRADVAGIPRATSGRLLTLKS
jgi:release factor glutamine methyltransferase